MNNLTTRRALLLSGLLSAYLMTAIAASADTVTIQWTLTTAGDATGAGSWTYQTRLADGYNEVDLSCNSTSAGCSSAAIPATKSWTAIYNVGQVYTLSEWLSAGNAECSLSFQCGDDTSVLNVMAGASATIVGGSGSFQLATGSGFNYLGAGPAPTLATLSDGSWASADTYTELVTNPYVYADASGDDYRGDSLPTAGGPSLPAALNGIPSSDISVPSGSLSNACGTSSGEGIANIGSVQDITTATGCAPDAGVYVSGAAFAEFFDQFEVVEAPTTTVPEPATLWLVGVGLVGIGFARRARRPDLARPALAMPDIPDPSSRRGLRLPAA